MNFSIEKLAQKDFANWDSFALESENASVFHSIAWKQLLEESFGFKPLYFCVKDLNEKIVGIAPAFFCSSFLKKGIVSMPFFEYGGPILEKGFENAGAKLLEMYKGLVDSGKAQFVSIKQPRHGLQFEPRGFYKNLDSWGFELCVEGKDFEKDIARNLWKKDSGIRTEISKSKRQGIVINEEQDPERLFELALKKDIRLGSPSFPKKYYLNLQKIFSKQLQYETAFLGEKPTASILSIKFKKGLLLHQLGDDANFFKKSSNAVLFAETIKWACLHGIGTIDFGRSAPNSSHAAFKKKFLPEKFDIFSYSYPKCTANRYSIAPLSRASARIPLFWESMAKSGFSFWLKKRTP